MSSVELEQIMVVNSSNDNSLLSESFSNSEYDISVMEKNLKFAWVGDFSSVKCWVAEYLKLDGIWDSPGGEKKAFYVGDIPTIYWWNRKKVLSFNGPNAVAIKQKLLSTLCDGDITKENIPLTNSPNIHAKAKSSSSCNVLSADLEGIKLDRTISQCKQERYWP